MTTPERAAELFYRNSLSYTQAVSLMVDMYGMTAAQAMDIIHKTPCWQHLVNPPKLERQRCRDLGCNPHAWMQECPLHGLGTAPRQGLTGTEEKA